jgi:hypothetical protein
MKSLIILQRVKGLMNFSGLRGVPRPRLVQALNPPLVTLTLEVKGRDLFLIFLVYLGSTTFREIKIRMRSDAHKRNE